MYSLLRTAKLDGLVPEAFLGCVLDHIANHVINRVVQSNAVRTGRTPDLAPMFRIP
jgi:hypothetical protein